MSAHDDIELRRYWIEFELPPPPSAPASRGVALDGGESFTRIGALRGGVGVTGYDLDDCLAMVVTYIWQADDLPPIARVVEQPDLSRELGRFPISPNANPVLRGIWRPGPTGPLSGPPPKWRQG